MQIQSLRIPSYRSLKVDDTTPAEAVKRRRQLETYRDLRAEGCCEKTALRTIGWSRATYFRWAARYRKRGPHGLAALSRRPQRTRPRQWTPAHQRQVWTLRRHYPFMGKRPLRVLLARQGIHLSESTVGRILAKGVRLGRIRPCAFCRGRVKLKKRRRFHQGHAQRWCYGTRATQPGQLVQIDHLSVSLDGTHLKEFRAVSPVGKQMVTRVYSRATARNARRFLQAVIEDLPFPLHSVQVDGGSEFRAEFEQACQQLDIPQFVLPPRRPQFNGCVERANDSARVEFWNLYTSELTVAAAGAALADYQHFYNHVRPHRTLDMRTPMEYLSTWKAT